MGASTGRILTGGGIGGPGGNNSDLVMLNINQRVTAVATGKLDPDVDRDYLLVGTPTNLLVYDVEKNADIFHKASEEELAIHWFLTLKSKLLQDVADGANAISVGYLGSGKGSDRPMAIVGGNCALQGQAFDIMITDLQNS